MVSPRMEHQFHRVVMTTKEHPRNQVHGDTPLPPHALLQTSLMLPATGPGSVASPESLWLLLVFQAFKIMPLEGRLRLFGLCQPKLLALAPAVPGMVAAAAGRRSLRTVSPFGMRACAH